MGELSIGLTAKPRSAAGVPICEIIDFSSLVAFLPESARQVFGCTSCVTCPCDAYIAELLYCTALMNTEATMPGDAVIHVHGLLAGRKGSLSI